MTINNTGISLVMLSVLAIGFGGCASKITTASMTYKDITPKQYNSNLKEAIRIGNTTGGQETNPLGAPTIGNNEFSDAVKNSLINEGLYADNGRYKLNIKIVGLNQPDVGLDFDVGMFTNYILIDGLTNKEVLNKNIASSFTATANDAFMGPERLRLATEGSGKENIKKLLEELSKLKIDVNEVSIVSTQKDLKR